MGEFFRTCGHENPDRPELADDLRQRLCAVDSIILQHLAKVVFESDVRSELPKLLVPSLILQCADDAVAPLTIGAYMAQHIPHATLHHMNATGHGRHMSYPEETIAVIRTYLAAMPR